MATTNTTTNDTNTNRYEFGHPRNSEIYEADVNATATGAQIIAQLREDGWLPDPGRSAFALACKERALDLDRPLVQQSIPNGARVDILLPGVGAAEQVSL